MRRVEGVRRRVSSRAQNERYWRVNMPMVGSSGGSRAHYPARLVVVALVDKILGVFQGS